MKKLTFGFRKSKTSKNLCGTSLAVVAAVIATSLPTLADEKTAPIISEENTGLSTNSSSSEERQIPMEISTSATIKKQEDKSTSDTSVTANTENAETKTETTETASIQATTLPIETTIQQDGTSLQLDYQPALSNTEEIKFAVWTENKQQDDLTWYTGDRNGQYTIDLSKEHKEYGVYNVHTYLKTPTALVGISAEQFTVKKTEPVVNLKKKNEEEYEVTVSQIGKDFDSISLPVWSEKNQQDDLNWYKAQKNVSGTYSTTIQLKNHHYESGTYNIHVYGHSLITGNTEGLKATSYSLQSSIQTKEPQVTVSANNDQQFTVTVSNVSNQVKEVLIPIWTQKNHQDDLIWYTAVKTGNGQYSATASIKDHHYETGTYLIHVYGKNQTGQLSGLGASEYTPASPTVSAKIENKGNNTYQVTVTDVPSYIKEIKVPVWSIQNGQDDIKWYTASKTNTNTYQTSFNLANHSYNTGDYAVHIYGYSLEGQTIGLKAMNLSVSTIEVANKPKFSLGQVVEIQNFATNESNGYNLVPHQNWIGTVSKIAPNTFNSIGGWEYQVQYANGERNDHVLEQDLRYVYSVDLKTQNTRTQNNIALQQAMNYATSHPNVTLYLPKGDFHIGSHISESDIGKVGGENYLLLSSNTKLRGNDQGTNLIVDGTMLWFGLPTGSGAKDGISNFTMDNVHIKANDTVNGDYFMVMLNHGNQIRIQNNSFTMVQKMSRHIFDLGAVQNITFSNNRFIGYAPNLTNVTRIPSGADLHHYYAETIQLDKADNKGGWDAGMIQRLTSNYQSFNAVEHLSSNVSILNNQFLPYYLNGKLHAYSSTVGQHSSQVGDVTIVGNQFQQTLSRRYNDKTWVMDPIHLVSAQGAKRDIRDNRFL